MFVAESKGMDVDVVQQLTGKYGRICGVTFTAYCPLLAITLGFVGGIQTGACSLFFLHVCSEQSQLLREICR
jgi:hypothetical protein